MNRVGRLLLLLRAGHRLARSFMVAIAYGFVGVQAMAAESPSAAEILFADCRLTIFARQAMQQDFVLSPHNLGVSVTGRSAKLWGAVPTLDHANRAEKLVGQVPGIATVKNELRVEKTSLPDNQTLVKSLSPPKPSPTTRKSNPPTDNLTKFTGWFPPAGTGVPVQPVSVTLKPPVPRATPPIEAKPGRPDLEANVRAVIKGDKRFSSVGLDINCGVIYLHGEIKRWSDLFELANVVAKVPGVQRVVLNELRLNRLEPLYLP